MFDEPEESPESRAADPKQRAEDKINEFRMHAELAAVFEGPRKFDAQIRATLDQQIARDAQKAIGGLEKAKLPDLPVIDPRANPQAVELLEFPLSRQLETNDYHISRRPGEVMILRWLAGDEVDLFYARLQAHFDAGLEAFREDQRQTHGWKQDAKSTAFIEALDKVELKMEQRYLRPQIREHKLCVLSTQTADEMDILHLCDYIMGVPAAEVIGPKNAPPDEPTERDRAWFFKLFSLRGITQEIERICFFAYLQKSDDDAF
jgi:hypothetical protein